MMIGHQKQWNYLRSLAKTDKIPHALLFAGQEQLGKKAIAIEFVKLLNCQSKDFSQRPCCSCSACREIEKALYPDLWLVAPSKKEIQISQIREMEKFLSMRPFRGLFKAVIIDDCHLTTSEAQSCLLKTLEEPKGRAVLILITSGPARLLPTVLSRVEKLDFCPVSSVEINKGLSQYRLSENKALKIIGHSFGRPGRAMDLLHNPEKMQKEQRYIEEIKQMSNSDYVSRFQYAKDLAAAPAELNKVLELWLWHFRNQLLLKCSTPGVEHLKARKVLRGIEKTLFLLSTTNINPRLALEVLMLEL